MPSSPSSSSNALPWCWFLYPWFFATHPDEDPVLGGVQIQQPNSPPAQMVGMHTPILSPPLSPAPAFPLAIQTHVGQFLTDVQYANLLRLHIFTQAQHDILLSELSNAKLVTYYYIM
jgi:hypothetical protein